MNESCESSSAPHDADGSDYWNETRRPLCSLAFLAPLLVIYEAGVLWTGGARPEAVRNGADYWLRGWLQQVGIGHNWLLPLLLAGVLLVWHMARKQPWRVSAEALGGMFAESLLFAFGLILLGQLNDIAFQRCGPALLAAGGTLTVPATAQIVGFLGAGIYEEFLFRLCLLPLCYAAFRFLLLPARPAVVASVVLTSLVFSLAHYLHPEGSFASWQSFSAAMHQVRETPALWQSFAFRTTAGAFFAGLFFARGFGITVGCHAAYDVLVGVLLVA